VRTTVASLLRPTKWVVTLKLSASSAPANTTVTYGGSAKTVTGAPGAGTVTVQRCPAAGGAWVDWRTAKLAAGGTYSVGVTMVTSTTWRFRARMPGASGVLTGFSSPQALTVTPSVLPKWRVTLGVSATAAPAGTTVRYSGTAKTAAGSPGSGVVTIEKRRAGGTWVAWRTATLNATGGYAIKVRMTGRAAWEFRAQMAGTPANLLGYSPVKRLQIS
jgi:hypothetical protein